MFTHNLKDHFGGVWLCGATASDQESVSFEGDELISLFYNQDNVYADLNLYDEGEYTFLVDFNRRGGCDVFAGYWYMDNGSFEPQLETLSQLFCAEPCTFIYEKTKADRYYGSLVLFADPQDFNKNYIKRTFEDASLDVSFKSFAKSVCDPIVLITDNCTKKVERYRINGLTLRGLRLGDGSVICDKLELRSGKLIRFIDPQIDRCVYTKENVQKYILPICSTEFFDKTLLPYFGDNCTVSSNAEIQLYLR